MRIGTMTVRNRWRNRKPEIHSTSISRELSSTHGFEWTDTVPKLDRDMVDKLTRKIENPVQIQNVKSVLLLSFLFQNCIHTFRFIGRQNFKMRYIRKPWYIRMNINNVISKANKTLYNGDIKKGKKKLIASKKGTFDTAPFYIHIIHKKLEKDMQTFGPGRCKYVQYKSVRANRKTFSFRFGDKKEVIFSYNYEKQLNLVMFSHKINHLSICTKVQIQIQISLQDRKLEQMFVQDQMDYQKYEADMHLSQNSLYTIALLRKSRNKRDSHYRKRNVFVKSQDTRFEEKDMPLSKPQDIISDIERKNELISLDKNDRLLYQTNNLHNRPRNVSSFLLQMQRNEQLNNKNVNLLYNDFEINNNSSPQFIADKEQDSLEAEKNKFKKKDLFSRRRFVNNAKSYARRRGLFNNLSRLEQDLLQLKIELL